MKIQAALAPLVLTLVTGLSLSACDKAEKYWRHTECQKRIQAGGAALNKWQSALKDRSAAQRRWDEKSDLALRLLTLANEPGQSESVRMEASRARGEAEAADAQLTEAQERVEREASDLKILRAGAKEFCDPASEN